MGVPREIHGGRGKVYFSMSIYFLMFMKILLEVTEDEKKNFINSFFIQQLEIVYNQTRKCSRNDLKLFSSVCDMSFKFVKNDESDL